MFLDICERGREDYFAKDFLYCKNWSFLSSKGMDI